MKKKNRNLQNIDEDMIQIFSKKKPTLTKRRRSKIVQEKKPKEMISEYDLRAIEILINYI